MAGVQDAGAAGLGERAPFPPGHFVTLPDPGKVAAALPTWATVDAQFGRAMEAGDSPSRALTRWGLRLCQESRFADAAEVFRAALALEPAELLLWNNLAVALDRTNSSETVACLEHSLALSYQQPDIWLLLGNVKKKNADVAGALHAYHIALKQDPASPLAWQCLGLLKQEQRDFTGAIDCFLSCARQGGANAALLANLGKLYYQTGRIAEANEAYAGAAQLEPANPHYRQMQIKTCFVRDLIDGKPVDDAITSYQHSLPPEAGHPERNIDDLLKSSFSILSGFGGFGFQTAAVRVGQKRLELAPASASADYLLKAVAGDPHLERSPPAYVVEHFDAFAEGFDAQLVGVLGYAIPEKLGSAIRAVADPDQTFLTLDAGCGTGLCGPFLKPLSRRLTGVDLSPKMLERARARGLYDVLACEELIAFLQRSAGQFDLIAAADVLIYFGDLGTLFAAAATALKPAGLLAFSTEEWQAGGYRLQPSGRFAHAVDYVRETAASMFTPCAWVQTTIRQEANQWVKGNLFVCRRHESDEVK